MINLYHDLIVDNYRNPQNFGKLDNPDAAAQEANASCGDLIEFQLKVKPSSTSTKGQRSGLITAIAWRGVGCAISTATASLLSQKVIGMKLSAVLKLSEPAIIKMIGGKISSARIKCAMLPLKALQKAISKVIPAPITNY